MRPGSIQGTSGKAIAPPSMEGEVGSLPIRRVARDGLYWMESAWFPDADELRRLNDGEPVIIAISAPAHPVIGVRVDPPPPEVIGISAIAADHPLAGRVLVWDEEADCAIENCRKVDCSIGEAEIMLPDPEGGEPRIETRKGVFTIRTLDPKLIEQYRDEAKASD